MAENKAVQEFYSALGKAYSENQITKTLNRNLLDNYELLEKEVSQESLEKITKYLSEGNTTNFDVLRDSTLPVDQKILEKCFGPEYKSIEKFCTRYKSQNEIEATSKERIKWGSIGYGAAIGGFLLASLIGKGCNGCAADYSKSKPCEVVVDMDGNSLTASSQKFNLSYKQISVDHNLNTTNGKYEVKIKQIAPEVYVKPKPTASKSPLVNDIAKPTKQVTKQPTAVQTKIPVKNDSDDELVPADL